jgi:hypothetical protein
MGVQASRLIWASLGSRRRFRSERGRWGWDGAGSFGEREGIEWRGAFRFAGWLWLFLRFPM